METERRMTEEHEYILNKSLIYQAIQGFYLKITNITAIQFRLF